MKFLKFLIVCIVGSMSLLVSLSGSAEEEVHGKAASGKDLRAALAYEFEGYSIPAEPKPNSVTTVSKANETIRVRLRHSEEIDFDGDGEREVVVAYEFPDKASAPSKKDFIALYKQGGNDTQMVRLFRAEMKPSGRGGFESVVFQDVTADGIPEICVRYRRASAGMLTWSWTDDYCIFDGHPPYRLIFECQAGEGWGDVHGNGEAQLSEIMFERSANDEPYKINIIARKGKDRANTKKIDQPPKVFEFISDRYKEK